MWVWLVPLFLGALRCFLGFVRFLLVCCHQAGAVSGYHWLSSSCCSALIHSLFEGPPQLLLMDLTPLLEKPPHLVWLCLFGLERAPFATEGLGLYTSQGGKCSLRLRFSI